MTSIVFYSILFIIIIGILSCINFPFLSSAVEEKDRENLQSTQLLKDRDNKTISPHSIVFSDQNLSVKQNLGLVSKAFTSNLGTRQKIRITG